MEVDALNGGKEDLMAAAKERDKRFRSMESELIQVGVGGVWWVWGVWGKFGGCGVFGESLVGVGCLGKVGDL